MSSTDVSPSPTPSTTPLGSTHAPKFGTVIPNRIFVGGIAANTTEGELKQFFTSYGAVKDSKIIADRAGVSKGYGFITFENQEDAERIIKKEADNLVFKDRKLNIGPAIRKQVDKQYALDDISQSIGLDKYMQVLPRTYDPNLPTGTVMFTNGVPYTYQNGMAIFHAPEGGYPIPQPQPSYSTAVMVPQTPTMYMAPQYSAAAYQPQATPQWPATAAAAQWRWAPQSPTQTVGSNPGYVFAAMHSPELMYAQPPPHAYQPELADTAVLEGAPVEGSVVHFDQNLGNRTYVSDAASTTDQPNPVATVIPVHPGTPTVTQPIPVPSKTAAVTPYRKPPPTITRIPQRTFSSPTYLVHHGNKVQRVMVPSGGPAAFLAQSEHGSGDATEGVPRSGPLTPPPTPDSK